MACICRGISKGIFSLDVVRKFNGQGSLTLGREENQGLTECKIQNTVHSMKIANVWPQTSLILHKKEKPEYLGSNVNSIPTAPCFYFVYYVIHAACADNTAAKVSSPGNFISG